MKKENPNIIIISQITCAGDVIPVEHICLPSENWGSTSIAFANAKMDCAREAKRGTVELKK